jgi:hypothetical protein
MLVQWTRRLRVSESRLHIPGGKQQGEREPADRTLVRVARVALDRPAACERIRGQTSHGQSAHSDRHMGSSSDGVHGLLLEIYGARAIERRHRDFALSRSWKPADEMWRIVASRGAGGPEAVRYAA